MNPLGDSLQSVSSMIAGVHGSHVREQGLGGADVAGGFFAADMLLTCLQREPKGWAAARIFRDADEPARNLALIGIARRQEGGVRSAIAQGNTESLRAADGDVRSELTGRFEQR